MHINYAQKHILLLMYLQPSKSTYKQCKGFRVAHFNHLMAQTSYPPKHCGQTKNVCPYTFLCGHVFALKDLRCEWPTSTEKYVVEVPVLHLIILLSVWAAWSLGEGRGKSKMSKISKLDIACEHRSYRRWASSISTRAQKVGQE